MLIRKRHQYKSLTFERKQYNAGGGTRVSKSLSSDILHLTDLIRPNTKRRTPIPRPCPPSSFLDPWRQKRRPNSSFIVVIKADKCHRYRILAQTRPQRQTTIIVLVKAHPVSSSKADLYRRFIVFLCYVIYFVVLWTEWLLY